MKEYIVNLTNHLIGKNGFDRIFSRKASEEFILHVRDHLLAGDVRRMSPAKLGEIMFSLEVGDVMTKKDKLFPQVTFYGDCGELLLELVSLCLAHAIHERLSPDSVSGAPPWSRRRQK